MSTIDARSGRHRPGARLPGRTVTSTGGDLLPLGRFRPGQPRYRPPPVRGVRAARSVHRHLRRLPAGTRTPVSRRARRRDGGARVGGRQRARTGHRYQPVGGRGQQCGCGTGGAARAARRRRVGAAGRVPAAAPAGARRPAHAVEAGVRRDPGIRRACGDADVAALPGEASRYRPTRCRPAPPN